MDDIISILSRNVFSENSDFDIGEFMKQKRYDGGEEGEEISPTINKKEVKTIKGTIEWKDPMFGKTASKMQNQYAKLVEDDSWVFSPIKFKSPFFKYTIKGAKDKRDYKMMGHDIFHVVEVRIQPLPLNMALAEAMIDEMLDHKDMEDLEFDFTQCAWLSDPKYIELVRAKREAEYIIDSEQFIITISNSGRVFRDAFLNNIHFKRYFHHEIITVLCPTYYNEDIILNMQWDDIPRLFKFIQKEPHMLCFSKLINFECEIPDEIKDFASSMINRPDGLTRIPEIGYDALVSAIESFSNNETELWHLVACLIYNELKKQTYGEKHNFTPKSMLISAHKRLDGDADIEDFEKASVWLTKYEIIMIDSESDYYLSQVYRSETSLVKSIELLFVKAVAENVAGLVVPDEMTVDQKQLPPAYRTLDLSTIRSKQGFELCSEQVEALLKIQKYPIVVINGLGGSGKTDFLDSLNHLYDINNIISCSYMSVNTGALGAIFKGKAFTLHQLLYIHRKTCLNPNNPLIAYAISDAQKKLKKEDESKKSKLQQTKEEVIEDKKKYKKEMLGEEDEDENELEFMNDIIDKNGLKPNTNPNENIYTRLKKSKLGIKYKRCIFEDVMLSVFEEGSTLYDELIAEFMSAVHCCGKLQKVVVIGDVNQLPASKPGEFFKELYDALKDSGLAMKFAHNHRVNKSSIILKSNSESIAKGKGGLVKFNGDSSIHHEWKSIFGQDFSIQTNNLEKILTSTLKKHDIDEYTHHVITPTNKYKSQLQFMEEKYYFDKQFKGQNVTYRKNCYWLNRKVCFKQNNYELGLNNNEILILKRIEDRYTLLGPSGKRRYDSRYPGNTSVTLEKDWERILFLSPVNNPTLVKEVPWDEWTQKWIRRASATTCHAYQGSQSPTIIKVLPYFSKFVTRELIYTAFSRPTNRMIFIGNKQDLMRAIANPEPKRRTKLGKRTKLIVDRFIGSLPEVDLTRANDLRYKEQKEEAQAKEKDEKNVTLNVSINVKKEITNVILPPTQKSMGTFIIQKKQEPVKKPIIEKIPESKKPKVEEKEKKRKEPEKKNKKEKKSKKEKKHKKEEVTKRRKTTKEIENEIINCL
jgi:hypothetical protein